MASVRSTKKQSEKAILSQEYWRIYVLAFFIFFAASCIIVKLYCLQVLAHQEYVDMAENQHIRTFEINANRGEIFLKDEKDLYPLAVNQELQLAYAVPREMKDREDVATKLAEILGIDQAEIANKIQNPQSMYAVLKRKLSDGEADRIREAKISGVYLTPESFRYYPAGELASQVVGFVGSDGQKNKGMYGLEAAWDGKMQGEDGRLRQEGDARGRWISIGDRNITPAQDGADLILTINHTVQYEIEKILKAGLEQFGADSGSVVVLESKTGKILAMANAPSFNPNDFAKTEDIALFANPAVSMPYESGSVFKTFTEAAGLDDGKISPDTTYVDTGIIKEAGFDIQNSDLKSYGVQTMTQVLENSLNTGVIYIEKLLGNRKFADYIKRFGFGEKTGIELPGELGGSIRNLNNFKSDINFYTASFGQGITVTPIQLAVAYGAVANDGMLMKPQIVERLRYSDGKEEKIEPREVRQVISGNAAKQTLEMLRSVVVNGHGKRADVPGYLVGGKTGTAQIAKSGSRGYEDNMNIGSFAGVAPINDPQFVVVVKMFNPKNVEWAESSAAPLFGRVMKFLLEYYKVEPTEDPSSSPLAKMAPLPEPSNLTTKDDEDKKEKSENTSDSGVDSEKKKNSE